MGPFRTLQQWRPRPRVMAPTALVDSDDYEDCENVQQLVGGKQSPQPPSRFWQDEDGNIPKAATTATPPVPALRWGTFTEIDANQNPIKFNMFYRDEANDSTEERENVALLKQTRSQENMNSKELDDFYCDATLEEEELCLLAPPENIFGGSNLSYDLDTLDESSFKEDGIPTWILQMESLRVSSPLSLAEDSMDAPPPPPPVPVPERPTDPVVVALIEQQEKSLPSDSLPYQPHYHDSAGATHGSSPPTAQQQAWKNKLKATVMSQNRAAVRRRAVAQRLNRNRNHFEFDHHLETVREIASEDERTSVGSCRTPNTASKRRRPPAITTLILEFDNESDRHNTKVQKRDDGMTVGTYSTDGPTLSEGSI